MTLRLTPVTIKEAKAFVARHHRRLPPPVSGIFAVGVANGKAIAGVAIVGRPSSRNRDRGYTAEVTRVCVLENTPNGCSMLYGACWRAAKAIGYTRIITYTNASESGASLRAAGWQLIGQTAGHNWSTPSRARNDLNPGVKNIWAMGEDPGAPRPTVTPEDSLQPALWTDPPTTDSDPTGPTDKQIAKKTEEP